MAKNPKEDLFADSTMTFGEHLEELRQCLFRAAIGLVIGVGFGLFYADEVVQQIQVPLKVSLRSYYRNQALDRIQDDDIAQAELAGLITNEDYVSNDIEVELDQLLMRLKAAVPSQLGTLDFAPYSFVPEDFILEADDSALESDKQSKHRKFLEHVKTNLDSQQPWAVFLYGLLDETQRSVFDGLTNSGEATVVDAVGVLNHWADEVSLYKDKHIRELVKKSIEGPETWWSQLDTIGEENKINVDKVFETFTKAIETPIEGTTIQDRQRRVNKFALSSAFPDYLRSARPATITLPVWEKKDIRVQTLNAHEGFMIWLKAAFIAGFVIGSPWIFFQLWSFVAAGLYPHERKYVYMYLPFCLALFFGGAAMAFFVVMEPVLDFLFSYNRMMAIDPDPRISEWLGFVMFLPIGFGIAFQLPLVMLMLQRIGIFTTKAYLAKWRVAILVIFIIAMFLTPADPLSMLLLGGPLTVLYFLGILLCKFMPRNKNPYTESYDPV
ncbi:MAG: twin-arginine translocase subunit TatC [Planctomycetaceae bacterium]|nr:twin-arginine translocase subunit TatC [Planctomycetaceae bacterium]